jgi:hypothetical protein
MPLCPLPFEIYQKEKEKKKVHKKRRKSKKRLRSVRGRWLNCLFREELFFLLRYETPPQWRPDQPIEEERPVDQHDEPQHLQPLERLPAQEQRGDPDEQRSAGVNSGPGRRAHRPRHRQTEEVESPARGS